MILVEGRLSGFNNSGGDAPSYTRGGREKGEGVERWEGGKKDNQRMKPSRRAIENSFLAARNQTLRDFVGIFFAPKTRSIVAIKEASKSFLFFLIPIV